MIANKFAGLVPTIVLNMNPPGGLKGEQSFCFIPYYYCDFANEC